MEERRNPKEAVSCNWWNWTHRFSHKRFGSSRNDCRFCDFILAPPFLLPSPFVWDCYIQHLLPNIVLFPERGKIPCDENITPSGKILNPFRQPRTSMQKGDNGQTEESRKNSQRTICMHDVRTSMTLAFSIIILV